MPSTTTSNSKQKTPPLGECIARDRFSRYADEDARNSIRMRVLHPDDVLMGRGVARNEFAGNVRYRDIVARHKEEYLATKKRSHKDVVARKVIKAVESNGGRFLRALGLSGEDQDLFVVEERSIVLEKVKQALRFVGREMKNQFHHRITTGGEASSGSLTTSSLRTNADRKTSASSSYGGPALQSAVSPSMSQASVAIAESLALFETSLIQALLQNRSLLDAISSADQAQYNHSSVDASRQPAGSLVASSTFLQNCDDACPNLLAILLAGGGSGPALHLPMVPVSSSYPGRCEGSLESIVAQIVTPRRDILNTLPNRYISRSALSNTTSASVNALQAVLPSMNDNNIRMILSVLHSHLHSE